jgi:protein-S-isoprenylcysteine O-methyltransferase Ste14
MILFLSGIALVIVSSHKLIRTAKFYGNRIQIDPTPEKLVTTGLYRVVRHPLYFGCIITLFGWCLFWRALYCLYFLVPIFIIGLMIKAFQEERDLEKVFGDEYKEYKRNVGMLFPKIKRKK